jgi:hypothetical protein
MNTYWDIVHSLTKKDKLMTLWLRTGHTEDELVTLCVRGVDINSAAIGIVGPCSGARFLWVAPKKKLGI